MELGIFYAILGEALATLLAGAGSAMGDVKESTGRKDYDDRIYRRPDA